MIVGISVGQETCLIHGQVSLSLLYWKKKLLTDKCGLGERLTRKQLTFRPDHLWPEKRIYVVRGETDKTAGDIQIIYGQNSGRNWEEMHS